MKSKYEKFKIIGNPYKDDFKRKNEEPYPIHLKIAVASTTNKNEYIKDSAFVKRYEKLINDINWNFGGSTAYLRDILGGYELAGKIIKEKVALIECGVSKEKWNKLDRGFRRYIAKRKNSWGQDSVMVLLNGKTYFI